MVKRREGDARDFQVDVPFALDHCEIAHAAQQGIGDGGVPRERRATSWAASSSIETSRMRAERRTMPASTGAS